MTDDREPSRLPHNQKEQVNWTEQPPPWKPPSIYLDMAQKGEEGDESCSTKKRSWPRFSRVWNVLGREEGTNEGAHNAWKPDMKCHSRNRPRALGIGPPVWHHLGRAPSTSCFLYPTWLSLSPLTQRPSQGPQSQPLQSTSLASLTHTNVGCGVLNNT